jgi:hypothetical protein
VKTACSFRSGARRTIYSIFAATANPSTQKRPRRMPEPFLDFED